jgi:hypothetical protein
MASSGLLLMSVGKTKLLALVHAAALSPSRADSCRFSRRSTDWRLRDTTLERPTTHLRRSIAVTTNFLTYSNAGISNTKYLIETFVLLNVNNSNVLGDSFGLYSGTVGGGLDIALRAMTQLSKSAKIS